LIIIFIIFVLFSLFYGLQISINDPSKLLLGFIIVLAFSIILFLFQTLYYRIISHRFIELGVSQEGDFQNPLDIWLIAIPLCVLMIVSYLWLKWHIVEIYFCTTITLTGMLFGNNLGRGTQRWDFRKSLPFFFGVVWATLFTIVIGRVI